MPQLSSTKVVCPMTKGLQNVPLPRTRYYFRNNRVCKSSNLTHFQLILTLLLCYTVVPCYFGLAWESSTHCFKLLCIILIISNSIDNIRTASLRKVKLDEEKPKILTLFFPKFPFDAPENIRKPKFFRCFQGDQKGTLGRTGLINFSSNNQFDYC